MYKLFFCILFSSIFQLAIFGQYVTLQGKQFKDENGNNLYPLVCNYLITLTWIESSPGVIDFDICPEHHYGENTLDNFGPPMNKAVDRILIDFEEIKHMGFNTIRLMPILQKNKYVSGGYSNGFYRRDNMYKSTWDTLPPRYNTFYFDPPYSSDDNLQHLLSHYDNVFQMADSAGLYVILVPAAGKDLFEIQTEVTDYQELLTEFCIQLNSKTNLLAYDLFNEPYFVDQHDHLKGEICDWIGQLYSAIHESDSNHLITIGGGMEDVMEWDPSVLKIDFWSPHFYPPYSPWRSVSFNSALQNVTNDIIWISNNCPLPWIIGETGFVAEDAADTVILVWGTEAEQANYAAQTLDTIRNAGGSGYSWWMFQHVFWEPELPLSIHNHYPPGTDDYYLDVGHYYQNNFGLLGPGEPNSYPTIEKPVVSIFQNYLDPTTQQPPTQGPPLVPNNYGTTGGNPPSQNSITAVIVDQDTVPIKDAVIQGWNKVKILQLDDPTTEDTADFYYPILFNCQFTFTDLTGRFTFTPYDYISPIENDLITKLKISCISGEEYVVCLTDFPNNSLIRRDTMNPYQLGDTIFLKRNLSGYIDTVSNKIINFCPPAENFSALNKLVIEDVTVVGDGTHGGMSDMTARNMIQVNPEFYAQKASKVHLFLSNVFRDCNSLSPFKSSWLNGFTPDIQQNEYNEREIDLAFMKEGNNISAYPNPTSGLFTLEIHTENSSLFKVKIMNMFGSQIKQMSIINSSLIDLSSYPKGVYGITVYSENILLGSCKIVLK